MNKRILAMAMAVVCALTMLTACGGKKEPAASAPAGGPNALMVVAVAVLAGAVVALVALLKKK